MMSQTQREVDFQISSINAEYGASSFIAPNSVGGHPTNPNAAYCLPNESDKDFNNSVRSSVSYY